MEIQEPDYCFYEGILIHKANKQNILYHQPGGILMPKLTLSVIKADVGAMWGTRVSIPN